ncbi:MAG: acyl-CoA synthetase [Acidimicrobiales bacterium]|nr:acyl-CoA synthetase [Acidimicrobiales bacterium]
MGGWNFADVWEAVADAAPERPALLHGAVTTSWGEFDRRADGVAHALVAGGATHQDKVALYSHNRPEYLETVFACGKASLVPVNTNYRYREDELVYLWDNADAVAVVFEGTFAERVQDVRQRVRKVRTWLWVDDGSGGCPPWAVPFEDAATARSERCRSSEGRDGDDVFMIYTGGTTGIPKGAMWRQDDLFRAFNTRRGDPDRPDLDHVRARVATVEPAVALPACPLMHGTGFLIAINQLTEGGSVVTLPSRSFDPAEILDTVERRRVAVMAIVGDAFCRPLVAALDEHPGRWDLSSLKLVISSGVMWSEQTKAGLLRHAPHAVLADLLGSSEALGMGQAVATSAGGATTARFKLGENAMVLDDHERPVEPGSGAVGRLAVRTFMPLGYYKDPAKTAATFREIDGVRWSIPGDFATIEADGGLRLLGRGSVCINTGGEKVFPEEVEEALKSHPGVKDSVVVGIPDQRFGEAVGALVEPWPGVHVGADEVTAHVKARIAGYKVPREILVVDSVGRSPNGKADYAGAKRRALELLGKERLG